ncbi:hypothetical protein M8C21_009283 [Ambrosia artemisiifolia]|uniref:Uncharacterized protein n=1 Tax=Ambrosia artemisiifolia TaxID=4212 RepID=A0AAD5CZ64_AMBAR|nr:hypothetical protein M8C21_009283 [Ambrosia artemisiifolia]
MGSEADPITEFGSKDASSTAEELVLHLQSSFFPLEFHYVAQTLKNREEQNIKLKRKAEEEKDVIIKENVKLKDQLKKQRKKIDEMRKEKRKYDRKFKVLNNDLKKKQKELKEKEEEMDVLRNMNDELKEQLAKKSMGSGNEQKDCAESCRPPYFSEKDSMQKAEPKLNEIIQIDDDDDDLEFISTNKRRRVSDDIKTELKYSSASRFLNTCRSKCDHFFPNFRSQEKR